VNFFTNATRSRITINLKQGVRDHVYTFMYPEEYTLTESIAESDSHSSTIDEEELDDSEDEDKCQWKLYSLNSSTTTLCCIGSCFYCISWLFKQK